MSYNFKGLFNILIIAFDAILNKNHLCQLNNSFKLTDLKKTIIRDTNIPMNMAPIVIKLRLGLDLDKGTCAGSNTLKMGVSFCTRI